MTDGEGDNSRVFRASAGWGWLGRYFDGGRSGDSNDVRVSWISLAEIFVFVNCLVIGN